MTFFQNFFLKFQGQCHGWRERESHKVGVTSYRLTSLTFHVKRPFHSWDKAFSKFGPSAAWFDKFLAHGQAHMGQIGKWLRQCTTTGLDISTELWMEKIRQAVTEIWVPQVLQPPARPPGRPNRDDNTPPSLLMRNNFNIFELGDVLLLPRSATERFGHSFVTWGQNYKQAKQLEIWLSIAPIVLR